jgi:hypothetical protein
MLTNGVEAVSQTGMVYQVTIIPSYLYSEMREFKIFNTSHFLDIRILIAPSVSSNSLIMYEKCVEIRKRCG